MADSEPGSVVFLHDSAVVNEAARAVSDGYRTYRMTITQAHRHFRAVLFEEGYLPVHAAGAGVIYQQAVDNTIIRSSTSRNTVFFLNVAEETRRLMKMVEEMFPHGVPEKLKTKRM